MKKILLSGLLGIVIAFGFLGSSHLAHATFNPVEGGTYTVSQAVLSGTQTTITLASFDGIDGTPLVMSNFGYMGYGTLDPNNTSRTESISFTGITQNSNGTATLTGVSRGLLFVYPFTASSTLARIHLVGAQFVLANTSAFYGNEFVEVNGFNTQWPIASSSPASKGYVDSVAFSGAGAIPATYIAKGYVQLATVSQAGNGVAVGSTGANLVLPSAIAQSSHQQGFGEAVIVSNGTGYLDPNWVNNNYYDNAFGYNSAVYSMTLASTSVINLGGTSTTSLFSLGRNGEYASTTPGNGTWTVPANITKIFIRMVGGGASGGSGQAGAAGGSGGYLEYLSTVTPGLTLNFTIGQGGAGVSGNIAGNNGTATTLAGLSAGGGFGGGYCNGSYALGGQGGVATGGNFNSTGTTGMFCINATSNVVSAPTTTSMLGSSVGYGSPGSAGTTQPGGSGAIIIQY